MTSKSVSKKNAGKTTATKSVSNNQAPSPNHEAATLRLRTSHGGTKTQNTVVRAKSGWDKKSWIVLMLMITGVIMIWMIDEGSLYNLHTLLYLTSLQSWSLRLGAFYGLTDSIRFSIRISIMGLEVPSSIASVIKIRFPKLTILIGCMAGLWVVSSLLWTAAQQD